MVAVQYPCDLVLERVHELPAWCAQEKKFFSFAVYSCSIGGIHLLFLNADYLAWFKLTLSLMIVRARKLGMSLVKILRRFSKFDTTKLYHLYLSEEFCKHVKRKKKFDRRIFLVRIKQIGMSVEEDKYAFLDMCERVLIKSRERIMLYVLLKTRFGVTQFFK